METIDMRSVSGREQFKRARGEYVPGAQPAVAKSYHATLPYPPQANHLYTVSRGRKILSSKARNYRRSVEPYRPVTGPFAGRLELVVKLWMPDRRKRDISNVVKALEDAMTEAGFWIDDSQIDDLRIVRAGVEKPGRAEVFIRELTKNNTP